MDVQHKDGDDDAERDENHGEEEVLADQRDDEWRRGDGLGDDQQEHGEGEEDRDAEGDLLATVRREVEDQHCEEGDEEAGDDEVDGVEERQAADVEGVGDVRVDLLTAVILDVMLVSWCVDDLPLSAFPEILQIHLKRNGKRYFSVSQLLLKKTHGSFVCSKNVHL